MGPCYGPAAALSRPERGVIESGALTVAYRVAPAERAGVALGNRPRQLRRQDSHNLAPALHYCEQWL